MGVIMGASLTGTPAKALEMNFSHREAGYEQRELKNRINGCLSLFQCLDVVMCGTGPDRHPHDGEW
jgi:hypothetical protein